MEIKKHDKTDITLIVITVIYNLALMLFTLLWIFTNSFQSIKSNLTIISVFELNENITYGLFFSGVLGGTFYCLRGLYQRLGDAYTPLNNQTANPAGVLNIKVWFFWYLYRPIQGGVLALILLTLLNSNLISIKQISPDNLKSYYTLVAIGFLAGFGSHELIHKIEELIKVLFAKAKISSSNSSDKVKENNGQ